MVRGSDTLQLFAAEMRPLFLFHALCTLCAHQALASKDPELPNAISCDPRRLINLAQAVKAVEEGIISKLPKSLSINLEMAAWQLFYPCSLLSISLNTIGNGVLQVLVPPYRVIQESCVIARMVRSRDYPDRRTTSTAVNLSLQNGMLAIPLWYNTTDHMIEKNKPFTKILYIWDDADMLSTDRVIPPNIVILRRMLREGASAAYLLAKLEKIKMAELTDRVWALIMEQTPVDAIPLLPDYTKIILPDPMDNTPLIRVAELIVQRQLADLVSKSTLFLKREERFAMTMLMCTSLRMFFPKIKFQTTKIKTVHGATPTSDYYQDGEGAGDKDAKVTPSELFRDSRSDICFSLKIFDDGTILFAIVPTRDLESNRLDIVTFAKVFQFCYPNSLVNIQEALEEGVSHHGFLISGIALNMLKEYGKGRLISRFPSIDPYEIAMLACFSYAKQMGKGWRGNTFPLHAKEVLRIMEEWQQGCFSLLIEVFEFDRDLSQRLVPVNTPIRPNTMLLVSCDMDATVCTSNLEWSILTSSLQLISFMVDQPLGVKMGARDAELNALLSSRGVVPFVSERYPLYYNPSPPTAA